MFNFKDLPIQYKLTLISLLISGVILILASTAFVTNDLITLREMMMRDIEVKSKIIAYNSAAAVRFDDQNAAGEILAGLRADEHVISARIYTKGDSNFVTYQRKSEKDLHEYQMTKAKVSALLIAQDFNFPEEAKDQIVEFFDACDQDFLPAETRTEMAALLEKLKEVLPAPLKTNMLDLLNMDHGRLPEKLDKEISEISKEVLRFSRFIRFKDEKIGLILLIADQEEMRTRLKYYLLMVASVVIGSVLVAWFLSARLQKVITTPILVLARLTGNVSKDKNYALRVERDSKDELGTLFRGFNEMLNTIQMRDEELARHRGQLENTVAMRTAELQKLNKRLTYQAYHDALTNLPNRTMFVQEVAKSIEEAKALDHCMAMLFLDLDHFKYINDTLGHAAGDRILQEVSKRLLTSTRQPEDSVARLGGDEFTVLLQNIKDPSNAAVVAQKIIKALSLPYRYGGQDLYVTPSIGISLYPADGTDVGALMRNADTSMYTAKQRGRNNYQFFAASDDSSSKNRLHMEHKLRQALESEEFEVWYQPRIDLHSGAMVGAEALVRWRSPDLNLVPPAEFIPLAEDTGLIIPIGEWVLRSACEECLTWQSGPPMAVSVNLSARQFAQEDLLGKIDSLIQELHLDSKYLELELTESLIMPNAEETIETLQSLKDLGMQISIDDFGTGYSSLSYLKRFPIDILKIDRAFIMDIKDGHEDSTLVTAIIAMAHKLNLKVVAEGVETQEQLEFLQAHNCDYVQGYLLGKPMPAEEFRRLLKQDNNITRIPPEPLANSGAHAHLPAQESADARP
ncbi:MAG: EAL domain-containing protein [Gammaproteobacteria bacterium]|nr:EAL domain-containing protein [Gammaproteobacteria bacterium]